MSDKQAIAEILGRLGWAYDTGNLDYFEAVYLKELAEKKLKARMSPDAESSLADRFVAGLGAASRN